MLLNTFRVVVIVTMLLPLYAHSALITSINNFLIQRTLYNVTFHRNISFVELFDIDNDGIYGEGDGSLINHAPHFFTSGFNRNEAAHEIIKYLGTTDQTTIHGDSFIIPGRNGFFPSATQYIGSYDSQLSLILDNNDSGIFSKFTPLVASPIVTFEVIRTVSTPPTLALATLALVFVVIGCRRRIY